MGGETERHRALKRMGMRWLVDQGFGAAAMEVRVPDSKYRADVMGCRVGQSTEALAKPDRTVILECKQARADFLKDHHDREASVSELVALQERRRRMEAQLGIHFPHLRAGDSLFREFESVDLSGLDHPGYREVRREIGIRERRLFGGTKLDRMRTWRCAHLLYLVAPEEVVWDVGEVPTGWGWLCPTDEDWVGLEVRVNPELLDPPERREIEILRHLARVATRMALDELGED